jgi:hypothetical protein
MSFTCFDVRSSADVRTGVERRIRPVMEERIRFMGI